MQQTYLMAHPSADLYGSDRVLLESVEALIETDAEVVVTLPSDGPLVSEIEHRGARVELCPTPVLRKSMLSPLGFLLLIMASIRGLVAGVNLVRRVRPDAVYVNTITIPLWLVVARVTQRASVCHVHEAEGSASLLVQRALAAPLFLSDRIISNSEFSTAVLTRSFRRLGARTKIILNGVIGPEEVVPPRTRLDGGLRALYVGRLSERKGVDVAVEAVAQMHERGTPVQLDIVGAVFPGYEEYEDVLRNLVERRGLGDAVTFHGFQADVWPHLAAADVLVVPSRLDEPFGNTAVEALLAERAVVVSDTSGLREASAGYESAYRVAPNDPRAIAAALEVCTHQWPELVTSVERDRKEAEDRHSLRRYRDTISRVMVRVGLGSTRNRR